MLSSSVALGSPALTRRLQATYEQLENWLLLIPTDASRLALLVLRTSLPALSHTSLDKAQATLQTACLPVSNYFSLRPALFPRQLRALAATQHFLSSLSSPSPDLTAPVL